MNIVLFIAQARTNSWRTYALTHLRTYALTHLRTYALTQLLQRHQVESCKKSRLHGLCRNAKHEVGRFFESVTKCVMHVKFHVLAAPVKLCWQRKAG